MVLKTFYSLAKVKERLEAAGPSKTIPPTRMDDSQTQLELHDQPQTGEAVTALPIP